MNNFLCEMENFVREMSNFGQKMNNFVFYETSFFDEDSVKIDCKKRSTLKLEVPGFGKENINIECLEDGKLIISGDNGNVKFKKEYLLYNFDPEKITATCDKGILEIKFEPKEKETIKIPIS